MTESSDTESAIFVFSLNKENLMPKVGGKKYAYTPAGKKAAKRAAKKAAKKAKKGSGVGL